MLEEINNLGESMPITKLNIPPRASKGLIAAKIRTIEELKGHTAVEIGQLKGIGDVALSSIKKELEKYGYKLRGEQSEDSTNVLSFNISYLGLTAQKIIALNEEGIYTIGDFEKITRAKLGRLASFGKGLVAKITEAVISYGGSFQEDDINRIPDIRIEDSILSQNIRKKMTDAEITTLGQLLSMPGEDILKNVGCGEEILINVGHAMEQYGYELATGKPIGDEDVLSWKVDALGIQRKALTKLVGAGIITIKQLTDLTQSELEAIDGIGTNLSEQVIYELRKHELELRKDETTSSVTILTLRDAARIRIALRLQKRKYAEQVRQAHELDGRSIDEQKETKDRL